MKKILVCVVCSALSMCHGMYGMFLSQLVRPRAQKTVVTRIHSSPHVAYHGEKRAVSLQCCEEIGWFKHDVSVLKYYCHGVFSGIGEHNNPDIKPSAIIDWLEKDLLQNEYVRFGQHLKYMPAHGYIKCFFKNQRKSLDAKFMEKYEELQDVKETWKWFDTYFVENALKKPVAKHMRKMVEQDRKLLDLADMGIFYSRDGKTMIIDPSRIRE